MTGFSHIFPSSCSTPWLCRISHPSLELVQYQEQPAVPLLPVIVLEFALHCRAGSRGGVARGCKRGCRWCRGNKDHGRVCRAVQLRARGCPERRVGPWRQGGGGLAGGAGRSVSAVTTGLALVSSGCGYQAAHSHSALPQYSNNSIRTALVPPLCVLILECAYTVYKNITRSWGAQMFLY